MTREEQLDAAFQAVDDARLRVADTLKTLNAQQAEVDKQQATWDQINKAAMDQALIQAKVANDFSNARIAWSAAVSQRSMAIRQLAQLEASGQTVMT